MSSFAVVKKTFQKVIEKKKKINTWFSRYLTFGDFTVLPKIVLRNKIINKT